MKNHLSRFVHVSILLLSSICLFQSCSKESIKTNSPIDEQGFYKISQPVPFNDVFVFPTGTRLKLEGKDLHYKLPNGYRLITKNKTTGTEKRTNGSYSGSVTCSCTFGFGCEPTLNISTDPPTAGCRNTGECIGCSLLSKRASGGYDIIEDAIILNIESKINFLSEIESSNLNGPKSFILEDEIVLNKLNSFVNKHLSPSDKTIVNKIPLDRLPLDYVYAPISFLGSLIYIPLNSNTHFFGKTLEKRLSRGFDFECVCNSNTFNTPGICKLSITSSYVYCDGSTNCASCTLNY